MKQLQHSRQLQPNDSQVAFTPKGGCLLKLVLDKPFVWYIRRSSIHPQGWVPIETRVRDGSGLPSCRCVAFTPKGGCPLKPMYCFVLRVVLRLCSIHPQGWVPIETYRSLCYKACTHGVSSIHPQGWVPIETEKFLNNLLHGGRVAFTPKGGCPLKLRSS